MNNQDTPIYPAQCKCGHVYLEKYTFKTPQNGVHGFCWCGFCRTRFDVKTVALNETHPDRHADCQDEFQTAAARGPAYRCDHRKCDVLACEEYDAKRAAAITKTTGR